MFILFFLVFTLIFTLFENIFLAIIFLLLVLIGTRIYQLICNKKILSWRLLCTIIACFILAGTAFGVKERRYYGGNISIFKSSGTSYHPSFTKEDKTKTLVGTGIISDISNQGKYVFMYQNAEYLLYSKKEYAMGDRLRTVGKLQYNTKGIGFSYRKISSGTFAIPLFSGAFDYGKWMKMKGRKGTIYETNSLSLRDEELGSRDEEQGTNSNFHVSSPTIQVPYSNLGLVKQMKKGIQEKVVEVYGKGRVAGLLLGMLIGDRSQIPKSEYQSFIDSGLVHLIAVSGGNILMIVVFLQFILFFIPFYVRLGLILLTIIGYSLICGLDSSVFRAVLMGGLSMIAVFRGREIYIWRILSISCIVMLLVNPYFLAYDTGFLLSYSALIGIVYFQTLKSGTLIRGQEIETGKGEEKKEKSLLKKSLHYLYKSYISPSIGASMGIFPVIIFFMGKINVLGIIGNLLVLPIVPFVMIYGFVSLWLYSLFKREGLLWIEKVLIQYIYQISDLLTQYGIFLSVGGLRFKYVVLLIFVGLFIFWRFRHRNQGKVTRDKDIKE